MNLNNNTYQKVKERLVQVGLKATHPRIAVLHALISADDHPTTDQVYGCIQEANPSISLGSVYRILEKLVEYNLVYHVASKSGIKRYDARLDEHAHIYCVNTEEIQDYHDEELNRLIKSYFEKKRIDNFKITDIKLQINGEKHDPSARVTIK